MNLPVKSISDYISEIEKKLKQTKVDHTITVFRGESKVYDTPCQPKDYKVDCQRWKETFNSLINNFADTAEALMQEYPDSAIQICRRELLL